LGKKRGALSGSSAQICQLLPFFSSAGHLLLPFFCGRSFFLDPKRAFLLSFFSQEQRNSRLALSGVFFSSLDHSFSVTLSPSLVPSFPIVTSDDTASFFFNSGFPRISTPFGMKDLGFSCSADFGAFSTDEVQRLLPLSTGASNFSRWMISSYNLFFVYCFFFCRRVLGPDTKPPAQQHHCTSLHLLSFLDFLSFGPSSQVPPFSSQRFSSANREFFFRMHTALRATAPFLKLSALLLLAPHVVFPPSYYSSRLLLSVEIRPHFPCFCPFFAQ